MTDTRTLDLERLAERYADTHAALSELMAALEAELRAVKRAYLTRIKAVAGRAGTRKQALVEYVQAYPGQFESPRMRTLHGVKVGLQKGRGKLACANADFTIRAIERRHPDKIDVLLKTTRKPGSCRCWAWRSSAPETGSWCATLTPTSRRWSMLTWKKTRHL